jgi:antitoxin ChpS
MSTDIILYLDITKEVCRMSHPARLRRVGGSVMLAIPPSLLDALDLAPGAQVDLSVKAGRLVVEPKQQRRRYTLKELLAQCDPKAPRPREDREWITTPPIGRELL